MSEEQPTLQLYQELEHFTKELDRALNEGNSDRAVECAEAVARIVKRMNHRAHYPMIHVSWERG